MQQHKGPYNYTRDARRAAHGGTSTAPPHTTSGNHTGTGGGVMGRLRKQAPDTTVHQPPIAMYVIGGAGVLLGMGTNGWQMFTTFIAFWAILNPNGTPVDLGKQPMDFAICGLIAVSFQFALIMLCFRIDTTWKRKAEAIPAKGAAMRSAAVEIVQHVNIFLVWGVLGFVVDTIGDYTFVSIYTDRLNAGNADFIVFLYAVALYALSTIAFVRSIEYLWAGFRAADSLKAGR
jgi:hypothetical protein